MGLEILEEKFKVYVEKHPENIDRLKTMAVKVSQVQQGMRALLDGITPVVCAECSAPCCQCMPVEGWFTESDYYLFRMLYEAPFNLKVPHDIDTGCAFLGPDGCVLPRDLRPFPCVKVNCKWVINALETDGNIKGFNCLCDDLSRFQKQLWTLIK